MIPLARYCSAPAPAGMVLGFAPYEERTIFAAAAAVAKALRH